MEDFKSAQDFCSLGVHTEKNESELNCFSFYDKVLPLPLDVYFVKVLQSLLEEIQDSTLWKQSLQNERLQISSEQNLTFIIDSVYFSCFVGIVQGALNEIILAKEFLIFAVPHLSDGMWKFQLLMPIFSCCCYSILHQACLNSPVYIIGEDYCYYPFRN